MRYLKKFLFFIVIAVILQVSTLFYIDRFYLGENKEDSSGIGQQIEKTDRIGKIEVPKGAENIQISWDGKYVSYYEDTELKVLDTETLEISKMKFEGNTKVSIYKWVQGKNRIILGGKQEDKFKNIVSFAYLDLKEKDNYVNMGSITLPDKKSEIGQIECSNSEDEIYVKVNNGGNRNSIYKLNNKRIVEKQQLKSFSIGTIEAFNLQSKLLYEDSAVNKIYCFGTGKTVEIKTIAGARLLSLDKEDNIYIAQLENSKVKKIYWGKQKDSFEKWNSKLLSEEAEVKDLKITAEGKLYINNNLKGSVVAVDSGKETFYKGNFLQIYTDGVASIWGNNLIKTKFQ